MESNILDPKKVNWESILSGYGKPSDKDVMDPFFRYLNEVEVSESQKLSDILEPKLLKDYIFKEETTIPQKINYLDSIIRKTQIELMKPDLVSYTREVYTTLITLKDDLNFVYRSTRTPNKQGNFKHCELFLDEFLRRKPLFNYFGFDILKSEHSINDKRDGKNTKFKYKYTNQSDDLDK